MSLFGIWERFGLQENPYSQATLEADEVGNRLLVGRDREVGVLQSAIGSGGSHPTVEGPIGAGKSSLIAVAAYRMTQACISKARRELYLPVPKFFQIQADLDDFESHVYFSLAQTLIRNVRVFSAVGLDEPNVGAIGRWLNSPDYTHGGASVTVFGTGASADRGTEPNETQGFLRSGLPELVRQELDRCVPKGAGGIICVVDNLELLQSTGKARDTLDELRDRLFNIPQLRWVLCGSRGIVSRARSERLSGVFQAPLVVEPLADSAAIEAIERRIAEYALGTAEAPVTPLTFEYLYNALRRNLRDALSTAQEFALWLYTETIQQELAIPTEADRKALLEGWLAKRAAAARRDATGVQPRQWEFFVDLCQAGGRIGSSVFGDYGFANQQQFTSAVTALVQANLMVRETDPDDGTKTINAVTALGWLVFFFRDDSKH